MLDSPIFRILFKLKLSRLVVFLLTSMFIISMYITIKHELYLRMTHRRAIEYFTKTRTTTQPVNLESRPQDPINLKFEHASICIHPPLDISDLAETSLNTSPITDYCNFSKVWNGKHVQASLYDFKTAHCNISELLPGSDAITGKTLYFGPGLFNMSYVDLHRPMASDFSIISCKTRIGETYLDVRAKIFAKTHDRRTNIGVNDRYKYNVIVISISSLTRIGFLRNLPKSHRYFLNTLGGFVLEGYNVLGNRDGSVLLHLLTGSKKDELPKSPRRGLPTTADSFPWIWQRFKQRGYVTQLALDILNTSTLTTNENGFINQPSDHYLNPYYKAKYKWNISDSHCERSKLDVTLNWIQQFYNAYRQTPKFTFTLLSDIIKDSVYTYEHIDTKIEHSLKWFNSPEHADNTIFILTSEPNVEDNSPFLGIYLPSIFRRSQPLATENLRKNRFRLTTPFDVHAMLLNVITPPIRPGFGDLTWRSMSLFREVPIERTCMHATIHPAVCQCMISKSMSVSSKFSRGAINRALKFLKTILGPYDRDCAILQFGVLSKVIRYDTRLQTLLLSNSSLDPSSVIYGERPQKSDTHVSLHFTTLPGNASLEMIALYLPNAKDLKFDRDNIFRLNDYGRTSECILSYHYELRNLCYCI